MVESSSIVEMVGHMFVCWLETSKNVAGESIYFFLIYSFMLFWKKMIAVSHNEIFLKGGDWGKLFKHM